MPKFTFEKRMNARIILILQLLVFAGCDSDSSVNPLRPVTSMYARLDLNYHAILLSTMSPHDTVRLTTTPRTLSGDAWIPAGFSAAEFDSVLKEHPADFRSTDSTKVKVSRDGLVRAIDQTGTGTVSVIATWQFSNITRADTAMVKVVSSLNPKPIASYRHRPVDSLKVGYNSGYLQLQTVAKDGDGRDIPNIISYVTTSDSSIIGVEARGSRAARDGRSVIARRRTGSAHLRSEAYVYGVAVFDTFTVTAGYTVSGVDFPLIFTKTATSAFNVDFLFGWKTVNIGPGGAVFWQATGDSILLANHTANIIFDDPSKALPSTVFGQNSGGGNIYGLPNGRYDSRYRRFLNPGIYPFRIEPSGIVGSVIVQDK